MAVTAERESKRKPNRPQSKKAGVGFNSIPAIKRSSDVTIGVSKSIPASADSVGVLVKSSGPLPREIGVDRPASGFGGRIGQMYPVARPIRF